MYTPARRIAAGLFAALWGLLVAFPAAAQGRKLDYPVYKFTAGEEFRYKIHKHFKRDVSIEKERKSDTTDDNYWIKLSVEKLLNDGAALLNVNISRVEHTRFPLHAAMEKYDSSKKEGNGPSGNLELLADAKFSCVVSKQGAVSNFKPEAATESFWKEQDRGLRYVFDDEALRRLLPFVVLPEKPAQRGVIWEQKLAQKEEALGREVGARSTVVTFAYVGGAKTLQGRPFVEVQISGDSKFADKSPKYEIMKQRADGQMLFDLGRGHIQKLNFDEKYDYLPPGAKYIDHDREKDKAIEEKKQAEKDKEDGVKPPKKMKEKKGPKQHGKKTKKEREEEKKKEAEDEEKAKDKSVEVWYTLEINLEYRGSPVANTE
jgi:hypothetical protein